MPESDVPRRVAVFTGTRAEYGLLVPLLRLIAQHESLELTLLVSGSHLSELHGRTIDQIVADGFQPAAEIETLLASDSAQATSKAFALTVIDVGRELERFEVDDLVVLGDRFETLAASVAAVLHGVRLVHLHGGEVSLGALDERFRHAITKLADLHFVAAEEFAARVRAMGETPDSVFVCSPAVRDVLDGIPPLTDVELDAQLGSSIDRNAAVVVYHPVTEGDEPAAETLEEIVEGTLAAGVEQVLISLPNADPGYVAVRQKALELAERHQRVHLFGNLGQQAFLSLLRRAAVLVGNSSSGIIESPLVGTPSVNVGIRQTGRPRAASVVDAEPHRADVEREVRAALAASGSEPTDSPYAGGVSMASEVVRQLLHHHSRGGGS